MSFCLLAVLSRSESDTFLKPFGEVFDVSNPDLLCNFLHPIVCHCQQILCPFQLFLGKKINQAAACCFFEYGAEVTAAYTDPVGDFADSGIEMQMVVDIVNGAENILLMLAANQTGLALDCPQAQ